MRESENSGSVLERYEVPAMRVVPMECGRIVSESKVDFIGDTGGLGFFTDGGVSLWNVQSDVDGGLAGFGDVEGLGWGSVVGGEAGAFNNGYDQFWNEASSTSGSLAGFGPDRGPALQWSDGDSPSP